MKKVYLEPGDSFLPFFDVVLCDDSGISLRVSAPWGAIKDYDERDKEVGQVRSADGGRAIVRLDAEQERLWYDDDAWEY